MTFHDKTKFKQYLSANAALQKVLEGDFQREKVNPTQEDTKNK